MLSRNWLFIKPKPECNKGTQWILQIVFSNFLSQVSQDQWKPRVPSPPGSYILSWWWVDSRTDYFCTHTENSSRTYYYPGLFASHQSTPSSSFSNILPLPTPPTHLYLPWLPSSPRSCPPPPSIFLCEEVSLIKTSKVWGGHGKLSVFLGGASWASGCLFVCVWTKNIKTQKTGLYTNLLLTYCWQLCSPIILNPSILKLHADSYYGNYN